jgi:uncharacterized membrane protein
VRYLVLPLVLLALSTPAAAQNRTLSCSSDLQTRVACFIEQPLLVFGPFEVAVGLDTLAARNSFVSPYLIAAVYREAWSVSIELALPTVHPLIGRPNPFRVTFTTRF